MRSAALRALLLVAAIVLAAFILPQHNLINLSPARAAGPPTTGRVYLSLPDTGQPESAGAFPSLEHFAAGLVNGDSNLVAGVYVPDVLAYRVVQQPENEIHFVDPAADAATQYRLAENTGTVGLLAHNYSGGAAFHQLAAGETAWLVFGDGSARVYRVETIRRYQALAPDDPYGSLVDLDTGEVLNSNAVFERNYNGDRLVFQTCIERDGDLSWGRLFVIAAPVELDAEYAEIAE